MIHRALFSLALAALLVLGAARATAQDADPAMRRAARTLYEQGVTAATEQRWEDARAAFERSLALFPGGVTRMALAGAESRTGRLVAAAESYRRFLREAEPAVRARHEEAVRTALAELEPRIPTWTLDVRGLAEGDAVRLDETRLAGAALGIALPVDPGPHLVVVERDAEIVAQASFVAVESTAGRVELDVPARASADTSVATAEPPVEVVAVEAVAVEESQAAEARVETSLATPTTTSGGSDDALWIGLGIGGAALAVAAIAIGVGVAVSASEASVATPVGNAPPIMTF